MPTSYWGLARSTLTSLEVPSDEELQQENKSRGRTTAVILPAATSVEAPCTPVDDLELVSEDNGPDAPDGVSPVMHR